MNNFINDKCITKMQSFIDSVGIDVNKYTFNKNTNIKIGKIRIISFDNKHKLILDDDVNKEYFNYWKNTASKVLINDIKTHNLNVYYYIVFDNLYYLLREIDKTIDELDTDIKIIDKEFKIISSSYNEKFNTSNIDSDIIIEVVDLTSEADVDIDDAETYHSMALFNDDDIFNYE